LFASKIACVRDEHADDSIINVTGANAINVYLGVGVAWFMAVIKKTVNGEVLQVKGGEL
jgi:Ca2+/Na+ antiporter